MSFLCQVVFASFGWCVKKWQLSLSFMTIFKLLRPLQIRDFSGGFFLFFLWFLSPPLACICWRRSYPKLCFQEAGLLRFISFGIGLLHITELPKNVLFLLVADEQLGCSCSEFKCLALQHLDRHFCGLFCLVSSLASWTKTLQDFLCEHVLTKVWFWCHQTPGPQVTNQPTL